MWVCVSGREAQCKSLYTVTTTPFLVFLVVRVFVG